MSTDTVPSVAYQSPSTAARQARSRADPPVYPMPSERSAKSAIVVPKVVEATMVDQYRTGWNRLDMTWATTSATSSTANRAVPAR